MVASLKNLIFAGFPGYNYTLVFSSDGIDLTKKENQDYMENQRKKDTMHK